MNPSELKVFNWCKNKVLQFTSCCENVAKIAGVDSPISLNNKTDYDLLWSDRADSYYDEEQIALSGKKVTRTQLQKTSTGLIKILVTKCPLYDHHGRIIGTLGSSIDITNTEIQTHNNILDPKGNLQLGAEFNNAYLTKREVTILSHILLGHTNKKIAGSLHISMRTVETHVNSIKMKFQCQTKGDIILIAVKHGFSYLCDLVK